MRLLHARRRHMGSERLQGQRHSNPRRHIEKVPPFHSAAMQRREFIGLYRYSFGHKVGFHKLRVLLHSRIKSQKRPPDFARCRPAAPRALCHPDAAPVHRQGFPVTLCALTRMLAVLRGAARPALGVGAAGNAQLQTAQVRAPPLFLCPQRQGQLLAQAPGSQAPVAHPRGFVFGGAESFHRLSAQVCSPVLTATMPPQAPSLSRPNLPSAVRSAGSSPRRIPSATL